MRKFLLITGICFSSLVSFSQQLWFEDDFLDNRNGWDLRSEEYLRSAIKEGNLQITKEGADRYMIWKNVYINPEKDFQIAAVVARGDNNEKNEYGIVWSVRDYDNYYAFTICSNGTAIVKQTSATKVTILYKGLVKPVAMKTESNLKISKKQDAITFSYNDSVLFSTNPGSLPVRRLNVGFEVNGYSKVLAKKISVFQDNTIKTVENMPKGMIRKNLGSNINSKFMDAVPVISADGKTLFWATKGDPKNTGDIEKYDIWYSTAVGDTGWTRGKNLGKPINNDYHNWLISVSTDNNMLILANRYDKDGSYKEGIGISKAMKTKQGLEIPTDLIMHDVDNLSKFASYCLSPDQKVLMMAIEMSDSKGDQDLYVSFRQDDGYFSKPLNMGSINSIGKECAPFVSADGKTIYFSTNGRPGYGDNGIFVSTREDDTWTKWSEPCNLGPEINTPNFDADYTIPASGKFALMVSKDHSLGGSDIFRIDLPKQAKPKPVILIKGQVLNDVTKTPIEARISYIDLLTEQEVGIATSSPVDGSYNIVLPPGTDYSMLAVKDGFISESNHIYAIEISEYTEMAVDLHLIPMEVGVSVQLKNLFFETGKGVLKEESNDELNRLVNLLKNNPNLFIEVGGYTDNVGSAEENLKLSQDRADAIRKFLVMTGIEPDRVTSKGYGAASPLATNDTEEGRAQNRRVEFKILKK